LVRKRIEEELRGRSIKRAKENTEKDRRGLSYEER